MSQGTETFFTSIGCMDGRIHNTIEEYGKRKFGAEYPDTITEAGLAGLLTLEHVDVSLLKSLKKKIDISLSLHKAKGIIVHGHQECAGNPVSDERHREDIRRTLAVIALLTHGAIPVLGVFVRRASISRNGKKWEVEELA